MIIIIGFKVALGGATALPLLVVILLMTRLRNIALLGKNFISWFELLAGGVGALVVVLLLVGVGMLGLGLGVWCGWRVRTTLAKRSLLDLHILICMGTWCRLARLLRTVLKLF